METQITTLIENTGGEHKSLHTQHGVSFIIRHRDSAVLFDTGQDGEFISNAEILNIDLDDVQHVVLSHGHYDHTNGFPHFVEQKGTDFTLWTHPDLFTPKYATDGGSAVTYLGTSFDTDWLLAHDVTHRPVVRRVTEIATELFVVTDFEKHNDFEIENERFVIPCGDSGWKVDDFHDEVAVVVRTSKGLVVVVGCSHPGIMNMLSTIRSEFEDPILGVLGGTHLVEAHGKRLDAALAFLTEEEFKVLGLNHCTGGEAMDILDERSDRFYRNSTGTTLVV